MFLSSDNIYFYFTQYLNKDVFDVILRLFLNKYYGFKQKNNNLCILFISFFFTLKDHIIGPYLLKMLNWVIKLLTIY